MCLQYKNIKFNNYTICIHDMYVKLYIVTLAFENTITRGSLCLIYQEYSQESYRN